jgi:hypothetical protein
MVPNRTEVGKAHKSRELFNQFEGFDDHAGGSVLPVPSEAMQQPAGVSDGSGGPGVCS